MISVVPLQSFNYPTYGCVSVVAKLRMIEVQVEKCLFTGNIFDRVLGKYVALRIVQVHLCTFFVLYSGHSFILASLFMSLYGPPISQLHFIIGNFS